MSRIDELIAERCPNGVRFEKLSKVMERGTNVRWGEVPGDEYRYIDLTSVDRVTHSIGESATITSENAPSRAQQIVRTGDVLFGTTRPMLKRYCIVPAEFDGQIASTGYCLLRPKPDRLLTNFLFHLIGAAGFYDFVEANERGASYPAIPDGVVKEYRIPLPPLEVQREIARTLDHFTDLEAELEAELEARRRQYTFYRDALLISGDGWQRTTLGEIADVFDGPHATPKKTHSGPWYLSISSLTNGRFHLAESAHIGEDQYPAWTARVVPRVGDTMFSYETRIGQAAYWDRDEPAALGRRMGLLRPKESKVNPRFLTLAYLGPEFQSLIQTRTVRGATVDRFPIADMRNWVISIPPIPEQQRVVSILDKLDALVNDPNLGLPAELAARRKQHEYYRDRLLTFEEATA